jgi:hypothetical protein
VAAQRGCSVTFYDRTKGQTQMIPGWPYSVVAALESGRTSWTAVLDAVRLAPLTVRQNHPPPRHDVEKATKREPSLKARRERAG